MSFERIPDNIDYIASLSNRPNDQEGMTATELKRRFDQAGADIKEYINLVLLPALEESGAGALGIEEISGVDVEDEVSGERRPAATVQEALIALKEAVNSATIGDLPDGSLTTEKFAERSVTAAILALLSVGTVHLQQKAVTGEKVADATLETRNYKGRSVTGPIIALASILNEHLGSKVVQQNNMANNSVGADQLINGSVSPAKTTGIQKQHGAANRVELPSTMAANTEVSVDVAGVTANNTVVVSPAPESWSTWRDCGVRCSGQEAGKLKFIAENAVSTATYANVVILD